MPLKRRSDPAVIFLERFKAYGWYLDDLVLRPINDLPRTEKKKACLEAQDSLASRIKEYRPRAIVCLLLGIKPFVKAAAKAADCNAPFYAVAFPVRRGRRFAKVNHRATDRRANDISNTGNPDVGYSIALRSIRLRRTFCPWNLSNG